MHIVTLIIMDAPIFRTNIGIGQYLSCLLLSANKMAITDTDTDED